VVEDLSGVTVDDEDLFGVNYRLRKAQKLKLKQQVTEDFSQCCGSGMIIPDPDFSSIPDPKTAPKEEGKIFFLSYHFFVVSSVADPDPGSGIECFLTPGSGIGFFRIPDPGSRIPDLGSRIPDPKTIFLRAF
jgi:hypothetical protein